LGAKIALHLWEKNYTPFGILRTGGVFSFIGFFELLCWSKNDFNQRKRRNLRDKSLSSSGFSKTSKWRICFEHNFISWFMG
jgi:hypothetical protein